MPFTSPRTLSLVLLLLTAVLVTTASAQSAKVRYETALTRDTAVRARLDAPGDPSPAERTALLREVTRVVAQYEGIVRRYPTNGYCDNALWQGAQLSEAAYRRFARADDQEKSRRLYAWLVREYPSSSLVRRARTQMAALEAARTVEDTLPPATAPAPAPAPAPTSVSAPAPPVSAPTATPVSAPDSDTAIGAPSRALLNDIQRVILPDSVRVTLELDREVPYHEERIANPDRVFFDLRGAQLAAPLVDTVLSYNDDIVRQIRTGRHPNGTVRVVLDLNGVARHSVFTLYNPFRLVIDFERSAAVPVRQPTVTLPARVAAERSDATAGDAPPPMPNSAASASEAGAPVTSPTPPASPPAELPAPALPLSNGAGGFSLSRQLGLSVSRIVIDPGHGGHDPGASGHGLRESQLTLDVALRLEKLLLKEPGIEVVMTRRTDVYVPLEERTAIANRENADLFLSIHANASRNVAAHGVETYYLSFASSPDAEAVAARENSASDRAMHNLPDIIKAITLNNKLDESRDLAGMVQEEMVTRLRRSNKNVRNLGVKKAPFVVLIGASMPSVLAEMSFLTNRQEAQLLKTPAYKQRIAESLFEAVTKYRRALKRQSTIADQRQD